MRGMHLYAFIIFLTNRAKHTTSSELADCCYSLYASPVSIKALLVIDVQNDVVVNALNLDDVVGRINSLIVNARKSHVPVIWVQHSDDYLVKGSEGWQIIEALQPMPDEVKIFKTRPSSFEGTDLAEHLQTLGVDSLVVTGAQTDYCINATSNSGVELGYHVTLVSDAHTTEDSDTASAADIIAQENESFVSSGDVLPAALVTF